MNFDSAFSTKRKASWEILSKASGRWPHLLQALGGLRDDQLGAIHGPCPCCGGTDRYRWMNDEGPGGWYCSHCGGKNQQGGGGSGIDLLMRVRGWSFRDAIREVQRYYDGLPFSPSVRYAPAPKQLKVNFKHSELERFQLLDMAGQLSDEELFQPSEAKARSYSRRWAVYGAANYEAACSIILQFETERGIVDSPAAEPLKSWEEFLAGR